LDLLQSAKVVVVIWSKASVGRDGSLVQDEAERARARGVLLGVRVEKVDPPLGFGAVPTVDLFGWVGSRGSSAFKRVVASARAIAGGKESIRIKPSRFRRWILAAGPPTLVVIGFLADIAGLQALGCRLPGVHSFCAKFEVGGVASPEEQRAWDGIAARDCEGLRRHIHQYPQGAYAEEANRRLDARQPSVHERWEKKTLRYELVVSLAVEAQASEDAARRVAADRATQQAAADCLAAVQVDSRRLLTSSPAEVVHECTRLLEGFTCRAEGWSICEIEERVVDRREICP